MWRPASRVHHSKPCSHDVIRTLAELERLGLCGGSTGLQSGQEMTDGFASSHSGRAIIAEIVS